MSINVAAISGNLARDAELRATASGTQVLTFTVAVNERVKDGDEWKDRPSFIDCTVFGKRAEALSRIISKGSKVAVQGRLRQSTWERDGQKRSKLEIIADEVDVMQKPREARETQETQDGWSVYDFDCPF